MPAFIGRKITFTWNGVQIEGVREKGISLGGDAIDITADDDDGVRTLLAESAQDQIDVALSGVTKNQTLMKAWMDGRTDPSKRMGDVEIGYPDGRKISGVFRLNTYQDTGTYQDATAFESEVQSSGPWVYTPAP